MRTTQKLSVILPNEMADTIRTWVSSGEYASESEVIHYGPCALQVQNHAVDG